MNKILYSINSLSYREEIFFRSIIVLHKSSNHKIWKRDDKNFDVLIVGKEFNPSNLYLSPKTTVIISMAAELVECKNIHKINLTSPIKATELIKSIGHAELLLSRSSIAVDTILEDRKVKLLRWPSAAILAQHVAYPILAALLSKQAMTVNELAKFSKNTPEICDKFLNLIVTNNDAEYTHTIDIGKKIPTKKNFRKSLLDKIKVRLGLN